MGVFQWRVVGAGTEPQASGEIAVAAMTLGICGSAVEFHSINNGAEETVSLGGVD
jgi:hypothetical protein